MAVPAPVWHRARGVLHGFRLDDAGTLAEIARLHAACGYLADPHSAVGIAAARARPAGQGVPMVAMATAHPAKFPEAMEQATGLRPALPARLADLFARPERLTRVANDLASVRAAVRGFAAG